MPVVTFACLMGGALVGGFINVRLPSRHLADETVGIVRLAANVFIVMTSVVISLMLASAKDTYEANTRAIHDLATEVILLDRDLRTLGPQADDARRQLLGYVRTVLNERHIVEIDPQAEIYVDAVGASLRAMKISDDQNLAIWSDARQILQRVQRERWEGGDGTIPTPLIVTVVVWLAAAFAGLGFRAPRNAVVTTTGVAAALVLSSALYLTLEMDRPTSGLIQISNAPFERALTELQR